MTTAATRYPKRAISPLHAMRPVRFEHRVCQAQASRVTYVNAHWQGRIDPARDAAAEAQANCPCELDYLATAGEDGWKLVAVVGSSAGVDNARALYLRRALPACA